MSEESQTQRKRLPVWLWVVFALIGIVVISAALSDIGKEAGGEPAATSNGPATTGKTPATDTQEATAQPTSAPAVTILSHSTHTEGGFYVVNGEVQNTSKRPVGFVKVVATFYSADNQVIATNFTYAEIQSLSPDQKSPFAVNNYPNDASTPNIARYELQVDYQ